MPSGVVDYKDFTLSYRNITWEAQSILELEDAGEFKKGFRRMFGGLEHQNHQGPPWRRVSALLGWDITGKMDAFLFPGLFSPFALKSLAEEVYSCRKLSGW